MTIKELSWEEARALLEHEIAHFGRKFLKIEAKQIEHDKAINEIKLLIARWMGIGSFAATLFGMAFAFFMKWWFAP